MKSSPPGQMEWAQVRYSTTNLGAAGVPGQMTAGGLDLQTPSLRIQTGALRDMLNFECSQSGGYSRIQGYERYDGRPSPSAASYTIVEVASFTNVPAVGTTVTQTDTSATGVVVLVNNVAGETYLVLTKVTGSFDYAGPLTSPGPVSIGTAIVPTAAIDAQTDAQYTSMAADNYRLDIGAVPGSGAVLGVVGMVFSGVDNVYAFRANTGGTAVNIYKSSSTGWQQVPFLYRLTFTVGSSAGAIPQDGDVLTQGGVTAVIQRVQWEGGTWNGNTATGHLIIAAPTGGNFAAGTATDGAATVTLAGAQTQISLAPGGKFEFVKCNFSGQLVTRRIYGCDGVNQAFEFDGTVFAPISTTLTVDVPSHITFHAGYLIISQGASIFGSAPDAPFKWTATDGAWEIACGDTVNAMLTLPGSATSPVLGVWLNGNTGLLYGTDPTTFNFVLYNTGIGAIANSVQNLFDTYACDAVGVISLKTTLNWGNFAGSSLTKNILPFINQQRDKISASAINRLKSQYRLFYSDGYGLWLTSVNQDYYGAAIVLFPNPVNCIDEGTTAAGAEVTYFGSSDNLGYVYQLDAGTSFDGGDITAYITMAWDPIASPRVLKRFRAASIEIQGDSYSQVDFGYQLGYGTPLIGQPTFVSYQSGFSSGGVWDNFTWDAFTWDGQTLLPTDVDMTGTGENVQVTIRSETNYIAAFTLNSVIYHYTLRRGIRV